MQRGSNVCCQASPATSPIKPPTSTVHTAALDSLTLADRQGVFVCVSAQLSASMRVQLHAQPRVEQRRLKMRFKGGAALRMCMRLCGLCVTRGTGEHSIGREIRVP